MIKWIRNLLKWREIDRGLPDCKSRSKMPECKPPKTEWSFDQKKYNFNFHSDDCSGEPIKLMLDIDEKYDCGFEIIDVISGRKLANIYACSYDALINDAGRLHLDLWASNEDGHKFVGNGTTFKFDMSEKHKRKLRIIENDFMNLRSYKNG